MSIPNTLSINVLKAHYKQSEHPFWTHEHSEHTMNEPSKHTKGKHSKNTL